MAAASAAYGRRAKALQDFRHEALKRHGAALRKKLVASAKGATGGDAKLSGMGSQAPKLSVRLRTERGSATSTVSLSPSPKAAKAPWVWIDQGTRAGMRRKRGTTITRRESQVTGVGSYMHPGTKGKDAWFGVTDRELPKIAADLRKQFDVASRK